MFTDIADFIRHSESMNASEIATFLNEHFAMLGRCVEFEGGTIDKFIGNARMAFWGAPELSPARPAASSQRWRPAPSKSAVARSPLRSIGYRQSTRRSQ